MSQDAALQTTFASGRYSKRKRTQVNYRMEELDVDETDYDSEEEATKPKKQRKTATSRPLPKREIFPFLELPAEIRNMIYGYALTDPSGIKFVAVQRHRRRCVERVSNKTFSGLPSHGSCYRSNKINRDADEQAASLAPSLLAVSKQIYHESRDVLYGNELVFADTVALYSFMINLGPTGATQLKRIRLVGWGAGRTTKAYNNACFTVLIWATNLENFYLDSRIGWYHQPQTAAQQIYRDAFPWLEAVGRAKSKFDAALDILEVSEQSLSSGYYGTNRTIDGQRRKIFHKELSRMLAVQQKRVIAKSVKRRTISKVSGNA